MKPRVFSFFLFLITAALPLPAQSPAAATAREEIVVTASALPEPASDTPATVTVITRRHIEERAARDVADLLREVPGLTVARIGSAGHATSLFTRGSSSNQTLVLWNGLEINNPFFGGYDWGQFSTAGVEQVEVVRGPYSALYGSDAVAGVVNILTTPKSSGVRGSVEGGGHGLRNGEVAGAWVSGTSSLSAAVESRNDDGFARNDDLSQTSVNMAGRWTTAAKLSFGLTGRWMSYELGIPTNLNAAADALVATLHRRQKGDERQIALPLSQTVGRFSYDLTLSESRRRDELRDPEDAFGLTFEDTRAKTRRVRLATRTQTALGTIVAGGEIERAEVDDVTNFGPNFQDRRRSERSLFVEDRWSRAVGGASRVELSVGVRNDRYETFGSETSPRLAAAYVFGNHKLRAAYGEAFRAPSLGELYSPFGGNPALRAERSRSVEAGFDYDLGNGELSATLFNDRYRDLITNAGFVFANVGRARSRGVELGGRAHLAASLEGGLTYTWLDAKQLSSGEQLLRRPRHSGSAFLGYRRGATELTAVLLHSGARGDILPVLPFSRISNRAYTTLDVTVQQRVGRITPYVKLENATDERYEEVRGYPSPSRRAVLGVRFSL